MKKGKKQPIPTRGLHVPGIGTFQVPVDTEAHSIDGEVCVKEICGWRDPELARAEGGWGERVGQCYSYLNRAAIEDVRVVLDIGHNVGAFTVWACRCWWPDSVEAVHAYDPNPGCAEILRRNLALVQRGIEVHVHTAAVTSDPSPALQIDARWGCSSIIPRMSAHPDRKADGERVSVPAIHPRDLPAADAIKVDAEGVEGEIVEHYRHWDGVKVLMIEWHSVADRLAVYAMAERSGLVLVKNDCGEDPQGVGCFVRKP